MNNYDLYFPSIVKLVKGKGLQWAAHVAWSKKKCT